MNWDAAPGANQARPSYGQTCIEGWAPPKYTDSGQTALHTALAAVSFAVAIWSAYEQMRIAHERYEIAKSYADLAQEEWNRFNEAYAPLEARLIAECLAERLVEPDYAGARGQAEQDISLSFGTQNFGEFKRYGLCPDPSLANRLNLEAAAARDDGVNFGFRHQEYYARTRDDLRWNRRSGLLNIGRNIMSQSLGFAGAADKILAGLGQMAGESAGGAMGYLGYYLNRNQTYYPTYARAYTESVNPGGIMGLGFRGAVDFGPSAGAVGSASAESGH
jgi:hypothetical protein